MCVYVVLCVTCVKGPVEAQRALDSPDVESQAVLKCLGAQNKTRAADALKHQATSPVP